MSALALPWSARAAVTHPWGHKPQTVISRSGRPDEVGGWEACSDVLVRALLLACTQRLLAVSSRGRAGDSTSSLVALLTRTLVLLGLPSGLHLNPVTSRRPHLQVPSHGGLGLQRMNLRGHGFVHSSQIYKTAN